MADEDKEKAEKLAAAKKRFEQLKKEQQKKGKKGAGKKKAADKTEESKADESKTEEATEETEQGNEESGQADVEGEAEQTETSTSTASAPQQSRLRSESFRQGAAPQAEVSELYRKQNAKIEELEVENKTLKQQQDEAASRLSKAEEELESLRESSGEVAELRSKAKETDRLSAELAAVQRQLSQEKSAKGPARRQSGTTPDLTEQLASKTSAIETLELQVSTLQNTLSDRDSSAKDLEERALKAEAATEAAKQELDALKVSISFPSDNAPQDADALSKKISLLESDLRVATAAAETAQQRATSLEQKLEAVTKISRETTAASQTKDKELHDLRAQLKRRDRPSHVRDASEFELGEDESDETGAAALHSRIRALEAENFDLRRGVWRDKRADLQPGMGEDGPHQQAYEDVDLHGPYSPAAGAAGPGGYMGRQTSTISDVITSGISAFTGRPREHTTTTNRDRAESMGLLSDDDEGAGFDAEAFRQAQEEDARRRVERIKDVKRGLPQWQGWRVDLTEVRREAGAHERSGLGPVFEV